MKTVLALLVVCGVISQGFGYPRNKPQFDTFNGFDDYMTDGDYYDAKGAAFDDKWPEEVYDKEEIVVPQDPNSVYPVDADEMEGPSGMGNSDDEDYDDYSESQEDYKGEDSKGDDYKEMYDNEVDYVEDELDYVEDDVQFNVDRIYELEDDLDYDEEKIQRMDRRIRKLSKSLKSMQNLVNAMETARLQDRPSKQGYYMSRDDDY